MEVKIQQWGNSAAIRMPAALLKQMSLGIGDLLCVVSANADGLTMKPAQAKLRYKLADLMDQCDLNAPEPAELAAWNAMQPVGREA
ncbi:antidote-toxin recognition MazE family protein [Pseudomonas putida S610]|uniref:AbrB/MazE/SpoVT family DNA-binding domain-containing protein n=1 Tax=Pseudomonas putida group TaxID=136845 RepID=UPI0003C63D64|nr:MULTISPECIES: antidote-toxin recognition MazE family protein [Pseudomonas putida group]EST14299.1 antidote-toxin recognition MazE family protein [Pseudomonas putida S610]MBF8774519.1 PbsX family transcriptional regulator [Pseudomonas fulva]